MRRRFPNVPAWLLIAVGAAVVVAVTGLWASTHTVLAAQGAATAQTVWDRVFTPDQATRGSATYLDECSRCHSETLAGGDFGPPVVGTAFWDEWKEKTAADLFDLIRTTMPQDSPGRLSASQIADVLAFLMKSNGFPAGETPLSSDAAALALIRIKLAPATRKQ